MDDPVETDDSRQQQVIQGSPKSQTICLVPIMGCLDGAEQELGADRVWKPINDSQRAFNTRYVPHRARNFPELATKCSRDAAVLNRFLEEQGFKIKLDTFKNPEDFGVASVLKVLVEWMIPGSVTKIRNGGREYPAVKMKKDVAFYSSSEVNDVIATIETKTGDLVSIMALDNPPSTFELLNLIDRIERVNEFARGYASVIFPMVAYDEKVDISWLSGLNTVEDDGSIAVIAQALQQTKFRMNEFGAKVESAAAIGVMRFASFVGEKKPDLIIDKPFLLWINRPGVRDPYFVGHFTQECWKRPDSL